MSRVFTHLAKDDHSWMTKCGRDLSGSNTDAISHNADHVTCEDCVPPKVQAPAPTTDNTQTLDEIAYERFVFQPLEVYEDETLDKAIYPGKGTGNSIALSYTLAGRINELGEYCEKFLPIAEHALEVCGELSDRDALDKKNLRYFIVILRSMTVVGRQAHHFKKPLRKGETSLPAFRPFTLEERKGLDAEDGDCHWYGFRHTVERAGKRSIGRILWENILKLAGRKERNTIEGDGDGR